MINHPNKRFSPHADLLLYNGVIITMDDAVPNASAVAIKDTRITWVGDQKDARLWKGKNTQVIDLKGCFVYPGFIETHMHVLYTGLAKKCLQLQDCPDKSSIIAAVEESIIHSPKGEWIFGTGWDDHHWPEKTALHAKDLDSVAPHNPVVLRRCDTHLIWVNSIALKLAGIDINTPEPMGGKIVKDSSGKPSGILIDKAMQFIQKAIPTNHLQDTAQIIQNTLDDCLQKGITSVHNAATDESDFEAFKLLASEDRLKIRIYLMGAIRNKEHTPFLEEGPQVYSPFLQLRCLKFWMDGALGSRGAALFEPYDDDSDNYGLLLWEQNDLIPLLKRAHAKGFQVAIHAIGDRANHFVLDAYQKVGVNRMRWRIEHAQQLAQSDIKRFAEMGVIAAMQPLHATSDMTWIENRLGKKRLESGAFLWRTLLDNGAVITGGSDAPVVDANPLLGIYAAITRQDCHQLPKTGWYPKQRVSSEEAIKMYTTHAAYACFREDELGSITPGKLADMTVLPENLHLCNPQSLLDMKVLYTIVNGKVVFTN